MEMSDTNIDSIKKQDQTKQPTSETPQGVTVNVNNPSTKADLLSTPEGRALAEKIRQEEKQKVYDRIKKAEEAKKQVEEQQKQLLAEQEKLTKQLEATKKAGETQSTDIQNELQVLREQVAQAQTDKEIIMQEATALVQESQRQAKMQTLREKRIMEEGLLMADSIPENPESAEALEEAIQKAKTTQAKIEEQAKAKIRKELGMNVPGPLAPEGQSSGPGGLDISHPLERGRIARLDPEAYERTREELLKRAEQATGWNRYRPTSG
jgi:DNA repair exonuclease SbcCD ATPase subunit